MKNTTTSLIVLGLILIGLNFIGFASAHVWTFDPSYTNYSLNAGVSQDSSGKYLVNAEFVMCKKDISKVIFVVSSHDGVGWCSGDASKCCAGGINELTGECNTNSCGMEYTQSCSIFGKTDPIKSCLRACSTYTQEATNYFQVFGNDTMTYVSSHPSCLQYGAGNTGAFISKKTFVLDSLTSDSIISAGTKFRHVAGGDSWAAVPIFIRPLDYYNPECRTNSDCGSVSSTLSCIGDSSYNITTTPTCSNGNCIAPVVSQNLVENCQNGCNFATGYCLPPTPQPQCTSSNLSRCGVLTSSLTCNSDGNSVNSTTTPGCVDGSCSVSITNIVSVCHNGCNSLTGKCLPSQPSDNDTTAPGQITGLVLVARTNSTLSWSWTNPTDSDFNSAIVYIDGINVVNTSNNHYMASGLMSNTSYTITVKTKDNTGNVNNSGVSLTSSTLANAEPPCNNCNNTNNTTNDTTAPGAISNLMLSGHGKTFLYFTWTNPTDSDFNSAIVYFNGVNVANTTNNYYNATGLTSNTSYTIRVNTKDNSGNVNTTNVSLIARTDAASSSDNGGNSNGGGRYKKFNDDNSTSVIEPIILGTSASIGKDSNVFYLGGAPLDETSLDETSVVSGLSRVGIYLLIFSVILLFVLVLVLLIARVMFR